MVTYWVKNGKAVYIFTVNGKPAAPGTYTLANGKPFTVGGAGVVINDSKNISDGAAKGQASE